MKYEDTIERHQNDTVLRINVSLQRFCGHDCSWSYGSLEKPPLQAWNHSIYHVYTIKLSSGTPGKTPPIFNHPSSVRGYDSD
mmetsp:Transcript_20171/g.29944  ORF Transcript_20171/g.29944 Transcript_20171/m.29944 type:complete len:82 (+) Transcript_20171:97-342(+)